MYKISRATKNKARKLGLTVLRSTNKNKKIDVFKDGVKIASIGAYGYADYHIYKRLEKRGKVEKGTANKRRKAYKARHEKYRHKKMSSSWLADQLLW